MKSKVIRYRIFAGMVCCLLALSGCKKNPSSSTNQVDSESASSVDSEAAPESKKASDDVKSDDSKKTAEDAKKNTADSKSEDKIKNEEDSQDTAGPDKSNKEPVALMDLYNKIAESVTLPEMYFADEDFMLNYYGIDASKLEDYVFASCVDSTSTDSIILIRLKDEASADEVVEGLNMVLEQMSAEMENYNPEANELVKAAKVRRNGKNIDLIIHQDREAILSIIDSAL